MRASSNNHYQKPLPFAQINVHSTKLSSEDETGYDSLPKQRPSIVSSSSSSSNIQVDRIVDLVKSFPSPIDISATPEPIDVALSVAQHVARFSQKPLPPPALPSRKLIRTRVQPILDSTSDSAESFGLSNHVVYVSSYRQRISSIDIPSFGGSLEYIHDDRFDSTTTVDHVKNDVIAIELKEQQGRPKLLSDTLQQPVSYMKRLGESIRLLPANVLAVVSIGLIGGLLVSAVLVIILA